MGARNLSARRLGVLRLARRAGDHRSSGVLSRRGPTAGHQIHRGARLTSDVGFHCAQFNVVGRYDEAIDMLQTLLVLAQSDGADGATYRFVAEEVLAEAWLAVGRPEQAAAQVAGTTPEGHTVRLFSRALLRARAASEARSDDAVHLWREALVVAEGSDIPPVRRERARRVRRCLQGRRRSANTG